MSDAIAIEDSKSHVTTVTTIVDGMARPLNRPVGQWKLHSTFLAKTSTNNYKSYIEIVAVWEIDDGI